MSQLSPEQVIQEATKAYMAMGFLISKGKSKKHEILRNQVLLFIGNILDELSVQQDKLEGEVK